MHKLVEEIQRRCDDEQYLRSLLHHLVKDPVDTEHTVILDNLHRFKDHHHLIAAKLGAYLGLHFRSRRRNLHCWRAFRALTRMNASNQLAIASAVLARGHWYARLRWAAKDYLETIGAI